MAIRKPLVIIGGQVQQLPSGDSIPVEYNGGTDPIMSSFAGPVTTSTGTYRYYHPTATNITGVYISLGTTSSSGSVVVDVKKNGTSIFSGTYPTIAASGYLSSLVAITSAITPSDYLTIDITSAGTGAADLNVYIVVEAAPAAEELSLDQLSDVAITTPAAGEVLTFDGTDWVNGSIISSGGTGIAPTTITVGASGYDYTTVSAAVASLANKAGSVEIIVQDGEIVESGTIELPATFVGNCLIRSANYITLTGTSNGTITGSTANWTVPFNVSSSTGVATGDWLIAPMQIDGATQPERLAGFHNVTGVSTGVVTAKSLSKWASVNSGNTSWANNRTLYVPKGRIRFTGTGNGFVSGRKYQRLNLQDLAILNDNTSNAGGGITVSNGGLTLVQRCGVAGFQYGIIVGHHSEARVDLAALGPYTTADVHDNSVYAYNHGRIAFLAGGVFIAGTTAGITVRGLAQVSSWYSPITITGTTSGMQAYSMGRIDLSLSSSVLSNSLGVATNYTPALNTTGNNNSLIGS